MASTPGARSGGIVAQINVTPLVDVLLVLLILFMIVTPMTTRSLDSALPVPAPPSPEASTPPPPSLVLELDDAGLALNRRPLASLADLESRLRDVLATRADKTLFVSASGAVGYGAVVEALDAARAAGVTRIGLLGSRTGAAEPANGSRRP
jgi:biopolymer transport protein ExbD